MIAKAFARGFERLYHARNRKKTCSRQFEVDLFDGVDYTIDSFYEAHRRYLDAPEEFYLPPPPVDALSLRDDPSRHDASTERIPMRRMLFDTPIPSGFVENDTVPLKLFSRGGGARVFILFVPGWGRSSQSFEEDWCRRWADKGIDTGLLTKPYHQARAPKGSFSGEYFISANLFWTIANFRQCVAEIRSVLRYMRPRYDAIGLFGMSSGGFQTGLAATCEDVDFMFPFITGCQLGSITWHGLITQFVRADLERKGVDEAALNKVWSVTDLLHLARFNRAKHTHQIMARYDSVIPTRYQETLWEQYGRPSRLLLESSHYSSYFSSGRIIKDVSAFIRERI